MSYKEFIAATAVGLLSFVSVGMPLVASAQTYGVTYGPGTSMCPSPYANYNSCASGVGGLFGAGGWFSGLFTPQYSAPTSYYQPQRYNYPQQNYPGYSYRYQPPQMYYQPQPSYSYVPQYSYGYAPQQYSYGYVPQYQYASAGNIYYNY